MIPTIFTFIFLCSVAQISANSLTVSTSTQGDWTTFEFMDTENLNGKIQVKPVIDAHNGIWWGKYQGILQNNKISWTKHSHIEGFQKERVRSVLQTHDGAMWFFGSTQNKPLASRYDGQNWKDYGQEKNKLRGKWIGGASCVDSQGHIWATSEHFSSGGFQKNTGGYGVFQFDGKQWNRFTTEDGLGHNRVYDIAAGSDGRIWFATRAGLSMFDGKTWTTYNRANGMLNRKSYRLYVARDGAVWCTHGDRGGISVLKGNTWTHHTQNTGMPVGYVRAIFQDQEGAMWFGTNPHDRQKYGAIGLLRYKEDTWLHITLEHGLPGHNVEGIAQTANGTLWLNVIGTGLVQYKPNMESLGTIQGIAKAEFFTPNEPITIQVQDTLGTVYASTITQPNGSYQIPIFPGHYRIVTRNTLGNEPVDVVINTAETVQADVLSTFWVIPSAIRNLYSFTGAFYLLCASLIVWFVHKK